MRIILASQSPRRKELMEAITKNLENKLYDHLKSLGVIE